MRIMPKTLNIWSYSRVSSFSSSSCSHLVTGGGHCGRHKSPPVCVFTLGSGCAYNTLLGIAISRRSLLKLSIYTIILLISVGVRKLQVAILARSTREMSLTVRIVWQYILSWVRASIRPSIFLSAKNIFRLSRMPTLGQVAVEWTNGTGNNAVTVEWPATSEPQQSLRYYLAVTHWAKTAKINQPKRQQWEFIPFTAWIMWFRNYNVA